MYIQQDATLHSSFYMETALHDSGGTSTHHQECIQLYLQHLVFVTPLLIYVAIYNLVGFIYIYIYIYIYPTKCNVAQFILYGNCLHVSGGITPPPTFGAQKTVSPEPSICLFVTAICHYTYPCWIYIYIYIYISNQMQRCTVNFIWKLFYMFPGGNPPTP
jgi:hypothetical protein